MTELRRVLEVPTGKLDSAIAAAEGRTGRLDARIDGATRRLQAAERRMEAIQARAGRFLARQGIGFIGVMPDDLGTFGQSAAFAAASTALTAANPGLGLAFQGLTALVTQLKDKFDEMQKQVEKDREDRKLEAQRRNTAIQESLKSDLDFERKHLDRQERIRQDLIERDREDWRRQWVKMGASGE